MLKNEFQHNHLGRTHYNTEFGHSIEIFYNSFLFTFKT